MNKPNGIVLPSCGNCLQEGVSKFMSVHHLKNDQHGYIFILMCCLIPIILLGTKWMLDTMSLREIETGMRRSGKVTNCAPKAALAVAKNWNPGIGLDRQKRATLKIADAIYNDSIQGDIPIIAQAIPGLQLKVKDKVIQGKGYNPTKVTTTNTWVPVNPVEYETKTKHLVCRTIFRENGNATWNLPFVAWKLVDKLDSLSTEYDKFDELDQTQRSLGNYALNHFDRYQYPHQWWIRTANGYPNRDAFISLAARGVNVQCYLVSSSTNNTDESGYTQANAQNITEATSLYYESPSSVTDGTYTYRKDPNNGDVKIAVENDAIKVTTKFGSGKAQPAECNVDIVLACPTNAAATNKNNRDKNSTTSEMPYTSSESVDTVNNDIKACPIYQVGQAFRTFAKEFYHTRGVTMGLIPYSGKVSLDPDVANGYTKCHKDYVSDTSWFNQNSYCGNNGQNDYPAYIRPYVLCDSYGLSDKELNNGFEWDTLLTGCPIRCRCGYHIDGGTGEAICRQNGYNHIHSGDILSNKCPNILDDGVHHSAYFLRQNSNPCYGGYANLLSMRCTQDCVTYLPNPYYIIEPTADVQKIYEICGAFYPFYDEYNVSNFIFIPVTWANNLWQDWTRNPQCAAVNTDASGNGGQLKISSKMDANRKKVLVLVVNKPDWFEHYELTYLGFDNDYSELPMIESDTIDFSRDYSASTARHFADGSNYDGNIQGPKKILKFSSTDVKRSESTGYYECSGTGSATLTFPRKYLVRVVVEPIENTTWTEDVDTEQKFYWVYKGNRLGAQTEKSDWKQLTYNGSSWMAVNGASYLAESPDALNWTDRNQQISTNGQCGIAYADGVYVTSSGGNWGGFVSKDGGNTWISKKTFSYAGTCDIAYGNGWWFLCNYWAARSFSQDNGESWSTKQNLSRYYYKQNFYVTYANGIWMMLAAYGGLKTATDLNTENWTDLGGKLSNADSAEWKRICGHGKYFVALRSDGCTAVSTDNGQNWEYVNIGSGSNWNGISYGQDKFVACSADGEIAFGKFDSSIQFTNIATGNTTLNSKYENLTERREFYIEPSQINNNCTITFNMENIRLISAEITNRPYTTVKPICNLDSTNIRTNDKRPIKLQVVPLELQAKAIFTDINETVINDGTVTADNGASVEIKSVSTENSTTADDGTVTTTTKTTYSAEVILNKRTNVTFPNKCFSSNYNEEKLSVSLDKAAISSAVLKSQIIRMDGWKHVARNEDSHCQLVVERQGSGSLWVFGGLNLWNSYHTGFAKFSYTARDLDNCSIVTRNHNNYGQANSCWKFQYTLRNGTTESQICRDNTVTVNNVVSKKDSPFCEYIKEPHAEPFEDATHPDESGGGIYYANLYNHDDCVMNINNKKDTSTGLYLDATDGNICFDGIGDLTVTLIPTVKSGTISHTTSDGNSITNTYTGDSLFITIDPDNYQYEDDGNGGYIIRLTADNVDLSTVEVIDQSYMVNWGEIRRPNNSRWGDYTTNPYTLFETTKYWPGDPFTNLWHYNEDLGYYSTIGTDGNNILLTLDDIKGDYTALLCSDSSVSYTTNHYTGLGTAISIRVGNVYLTSGLGREFTQFDHAVAGHKNYYANCMYNDHSGPVGAIGLIQQCITLPINTALWYAYYDGAIHEGEWYKDSSNSIKYDASEAAKNVTKKALEKLVSTYGSANTRIYVILFRKQDDYKQAITGKTLNYDYGYLNNSNVYQVHDVADEAALQELMKTIASEIKTWAGYKAAKIVK